MWSSVPFASAFFLLTTILFCPCHGYLTAEEKCEPIKLGYCEHVRWNQTKMPNFFGHTSQTAANEQVGPYVTLAQQLDCSEHLLFFICSLLVPMCSTTNPDLNTMEPLTVLPCRSLCDSVKSSCEPAMRARSTAWPPTINCSVLPVQSNDGTVLCMKPPPAGPALPPPRHPWTPSVPQQPEHLGTGLPGGACYTDRYKYTPRGNVSCGTLRCQDRCKACEKRCEVDHWFTAKDKDLAHIWTGFWAVASAVATLLVLISFAAKPSRFQYPVRPVICIVICHFLLALGHVVRLFLRTPDVICRDGDNSADSVIILDGKDSTLCIILFLIQYYFSLSAHIWWVVLTLTWFLAAAQKWGMEAIRSLACYFHLVAWSVPAVLAITVLVTGAVDPNELEGTCSVGNTNPDALIGFVVAPLVAFLMLGIVFLFGGFISLIQVRRNLKNTDLGGSIVPAGDVHRLEKLMAKIGLFSLFYIVAAACLLGALLYEYTHIHLWECAARLIPCARPEGVTGHLGAVPVNDIDCSLPASVPQKEVFLLKTCAGLIIGVFSCMWIFNPKTVDTWRAKLQRCCPRTRSSAAAKKDKSVTSPFLYNGVGGQQDSAHMLPSSPKADTMSSRGPASNEVHM